MANVIQAPNMMQGMIAPDIQAQQLALSRQQQLADMLRQQALAPSDTQMVSGGNGMQRAVPVSPLQGLIKMLTAGVAGKMQESNDAKALDLGQQYNSRVTGMLRGALPPEDNSPEQPPMDATSAALKLAPSLGDRTLSNGSTAPNIGPTNEAAAAQDAFAANPSTIPQPAPKKPSLNNAAMAAMLSGNQELANKLIEQGWSAYAPTDASKMANAAGADVKKANLDALTKANYIAPVNARPGSIIRDPLNPSKVLAFNPHIPEGGTPQFDQSGNVTGIGALPGATDVVRGMTAAQGAGRNDQTLTPTDQLPVDSKGRPIPRTISATIANSQPHEGFDVSQLSPEQIKYLAKSDPEAFANGIAAFNRSRQPGAVPAAPQGVGVALGQKEGAVDAQTELTKKFGDLSALNQQTQQTNSYLQGIRSLADKAATGRFSDKLDFVNSLLSPFSAKATDASTATDLLEKFSNKIVSNLGQGGLGTDAARTIIASANPNAHMTPQAIKDAVDNLVGANEMIKAKAATLSPHANARDPVAYQQKEQVFDQNADPRIWQWKSITNPVQKKAFATSIMQQDPSFPAKIKALEEIGAFK